MSGMNNILITAIDFKFDNGEEQPYTHVDLIFKTIGPEYLFEGTITVIKDEYDYHKDDLVKLIITKHVQTFGYDLA